MMVWKNDEYLMIEVRPTQSDEYLMLEVRPTQSDEYLMLQVSLLRVMSI